MEWRTGRITLFNRDQKAVAEVARVKTGWCWYISGSDVGGDVETVTEAMAAAEKALGVTTLEATSGRPTVGV